jgi:DNA-binding Xre family transcriptional regulator
VLEVKKIASHNKILRKELAEITGCSLAEINRILGGV